MGKAANVITPAPDDDNDRLWAEFREGIRLRLNRDRPSRHDRNDVAWMQPTNAWAANRLPAPEMAVRKYAEREVANINGKANREANDLLKRYAKTGQIPLDDFPWMELGPLPFTLDKNSGLRVRFDAATPDDLTTHAEMKRASATERMETELGVADVIDELAELARAAGYGVVWMLQGRPDPHPNSPPDLDWEDKDYDNVN